MHTTAFTDQITAALELPAWDAFATLHAMCETEREARRAAAVTKDWAASDAAWSRIEAITEAALTICTARTRGHHLTGRDAATLPVATVEDGTDRWGRPTAIVTTAVADIRHGIGYLTSDLYERDLAVELLTRDGLTVA